MLDTWIHFIKVNCSILAWTVVIITSLYILCFIANAVKESLSHKKEEFSDEAFREFFFNEVFSIPSLSIIEEDTLQKTVLNSSDKEFKLMVEAICGLETYKAIISDDTIVNKREWFANYIREIREERGLAEKSYGRI